MILKVHLKVHLKDFKPNTLISISFTGLPLTSVSHRNQCTSSGVNLKNSWTRDWLGVLEFPISMYSFYVTCFATWELNPSVIRSSSTHIAHKKDWFTFWKITTLYQLHTVLWVGQVPRRTLEIRQQISNTLRFQICAWMPLYRRLLRGMINLNSKFCWGGVCREVALLFRSQVILNIRQKI